MVSAPGVDLPDCDIIVKERIFMIWDSRQYLKFADERAQPCIDLTAKLKGDFNTILDLGCGPGNSTKYLLNSFKKARIVGFDSDDNMLEKARKECPNCEFIKGFAPDDLDTLGQTFDLIFSNACIHWIADQKRLIDKVSRHLTSSGVFAVQIPLTDESRFYKILNELISIKWKKLKFVKNFHALNQSEYYNALINHFEKVQMWQTNYYHTVPKEMIIEWYKGSGLRPYLSFLEETEKKEFLGDLQSIIDNNYEALSDGKTFLIMPRLFFIAQKQRP